MRVGRTSHPIRRFAAKFNRLSPETRQPEELFGIGAAGPRFEPASAEVASSNLRRGAKIAELHNADDLASPALKGKIVWYDPTQPGSGSRSTWWLAVNQGKDWLKRLFEAQAVTFSRDYSKMADWVVSCTKPGGIGMPFDVIMQMQKSGVGAAVEELTGPAYFGGVSVWEGANDYIGWFENPPHPAAAQLFVTWYLSREFQRPMPTQRVATAAAPTCCRPIPTCHAC